MSFDWTTADPAILDAVRFMPAEFTTHELIRKFAERNQVLYIEALYAYRERGRAGGTAPFQMVHGIIATRLRALDGHVELLRNDVASKDIFGNANDCGLWRRLEI
jgi:hypothetical protein